MKNIINGSVDGQTVVADVTSVKKTILAGLPVNSMIGMQSATADSVMVMSCSLVLLTVLLLSLIR